MSVLRLVLLVAALAASVAVSWADASQQQRRAYTAPETFTSPLQARTATGATAATVRIQIDRYHSAAELKTMTDAMMYGGYPGFVQALRKAPVVGYVEIGDVKVALRWAREQPTGKGRAISLVTERPMYFIGGGKADAKPREGFELAVVQLTVDEFGLGSGTMAAAARVKRDPQGSGVLLEDYAEEPIKLTFVHREIK
ncbi:MAG TPA: hypothetical protein VIX63_00880 [Vicinamibacterales bacterium]